jgi:deoxycytidylate deaminase
MFPSSLIIKEAVKIASRSDVLRGKIGAVLYNSNGHILTKACNLTFHGSNRFKTIHAEEALLYKAHKLNVIRRYGHNLYILVVRWKPGVKEFAIGKPCINCERVLLKTPFTVYYTDDCGSIIKLK